MSAEDPPEVLNSDSDDSDCPDLVENTGEGVVDTGDGDAGVAAGGKQNRAEKKARKAIQKLGMRQVPSINRCTMRKNKNILFVIQGPEVYKSPASETYVIFGEAKIEDLSAQQQQQAASQFRKPEGGPASDAPQTAPAGGEDAGGDEDLEGIEEKDVELVISQAGTTRAKAIKALKNNEGDIVNAIMELTM